MLTVLSKRAFTRGGNHILDDELALFVASIRAKAGSKGFVYVVVDACHAGGSARGEEQGDEEEQVFFRGTRSGFSHSGKLFQPRTDGRAHIYIESSSALAGACYIEACRSHQRNQEVKFEGQFVGPLSLSVYKTLCQATAFPKHDTWLQNVVGHFKENKFKNQNLVIESTE